MVDLFDMRFDINEMLEYLEKNNRPNFELKLIVKSFVRNKLYKRKLSSIIEWYQEESGNK